MNQVLLGAPDGRLLHLGEGWLPYIRREMYHMAGYPAGQTEKGDLFLMLEWQYGAWILSLGMTGNDEVQPVVKRAGGEWLTAERTLLDTVFCGREIHVESSPLSAEGNTPVWVEITIGVQHIRCLMDETAHSQLVLADEQGIYYFYRSGPSQPEDQRIHTPTPKDILAGQPFPACLIKPSGHSLHLSQLLMPQLYSKMTELEADGEIHTCQWKEQMKNMLAAVQKEWLPLPKNTEGIFAYTLWDLVSVHQTYQKAGSVYQLLEKERGRYNAPVATSFRLWGKDDKIQRVAYLLQKASRTNSTILLTGESGTGKTFLAQEIHKNSRRKAGAFVHVNCASIPYNLIESELFGYEEGAFTGAKRGGKQGFFELAHGGTLFLDEVTELPLALQGRLLEVLQSKTFFKVGGSEKITVDIRLVAATNRNLQELVQDRRFREDLFYRINVFPVELPPLRERRNDLFPLIMAILPEICQRAGIEPLQISLEAIEKIKDYPWPGNIRELENVLEKAAILCDGKLLQADDILLPQEVGVGRQSGALRVQKEAFEAELIAKTLREFGGERLKTAAALGISRTSLFEKMRKYKMDEHGEDHR